MSPRLNLSRPCAVRRTGTRVPEATARRIVRVFTPKISATCRVVRKDEAVTLEVSSSSGNVVFWPQSSSRGGGEALGDGD
jgi:hypothetical protein